MCRGSHDRYHAEVDISREEDGVMQQDNTEIQIERDIYEVLMSTNKNYGLLTL